MPSNDDITKVKTDQQQETGPWDAALDQLRESQATQRLRYGDVYVYNDGPGNVKQITLSIGFTEYGGNLKQVLEDYVIRDGARLGTRSWMSTSRCWAVREPPPTRH